MRRIARVNALNATQGMHAAGMRRPAVELPRGEDSYQGQRREFVQPFETALRFPAETFNYGAQVTIAQGAAAATVLTMTVPGQRNGVLRSLVIYSTVAAGMADLTELELMHNGSPIRGLLVPGAAPAGVILPQAAFEEPRLEFNVRVFHHHVLELRLGRAAGVDPIAYTYRARLLGWYWPRYLKGF